jgi:oxygen-dependent protoporphyrinogen oxidase
MPITAHGFLSLPHSLKPLLASAEARSIPLGLLRHCNQSYLVRGYASDASSPSRYRHDIAVVGGGITGLATAYYLSKKQDINVTLYEASNRLGGWIQTKLVDVPGGKVLFEQGPRTLRPTLPNGILAAGLV